MAIHAAGTPGGFALVGRAAEGTAIDEVLAGAAAGEGGVVAVEGDAKGVGKSRRSGQQPTAPKRPG